MFGLIRLPEGWQTGAWYRYPEDAREGLVVLMGRFYPHAPSDCTAALVALWSWQGRQIRLDRGHYDLDPKHLTSYNKL